MSSVSSAETSAEFHPIPAAANPFLLMDSTYVHELIESRSLRGEERDPFAEIEH